MSYLSQEFAEGRVAYQNGQPVTANPYDQYSTFGRLWRDGWMDASYDDELDCFGDDD